MISACNESRLPAAFSGFTRRAGSPCREKNSDLRQISETLRENADARFGQAAQKVLASADPVPFFQMLIHPAAVAEPERIEFKGPSEGIIGDA